MSPEGGGLYAKGGGCASPMRNQFAAASLEKIRRSHTRTKRIPPLKIVQCNMLLQPCNLRNAFIYKGK